MSSDSIVNVLPGVVQTRILGKSIFFGRRVGSTNEYARQLAASGAEEGTVVVAETQTRGRGRFKRRWISPSGGLWVSVILKPKIRPFNVFKLTMVAGLSVAEALNSLYALKIQTKWPNDLLLKGRKISGILGEASSTVEEVNFVIIGIGINANFDARKIFSKSAVTDVTSLESELGRPVRIGKLFETLLQKLEANYLVFTTGGFASILRKWKKRAGFLGSEVEVVDQDERLSGIAEDIDDEGALVLRLRNGTLKHVLAADMFLGRVRRI